jgi:sugar phosphate isomerase/epimerase
MAQPWALGIITGLHPDPHTALSRVQNLGIPTVQVGYSAEHDNEAGIREVDAARVATGIEFTTVFCGFEGERYDDIPTVRATVGLVPTETRDVRVTKIDQIAAFAHKLGVQRVAAHIGFIPEDPSDERYPALVETVQGICDRLAQTGQTFALETGQETSATLERFLNDVARENIFVNFDPANMILYGNDQPLPATEKLFSWIDGVHCKDGQWPTEENKLGHETPFGAGDVNVPAWIEKLVTLGYKGTFTIEREIEGEQQQLDILAAKKLIQDELNKHSLEA